MKYLTIEDMKAHLRLDSDCEDALLDLYGTGAEDAVLKLLNRTYEDVLEEWGEVPAAVRNATLLLVGESFKTREPASAQNLSVVPYGFDMLVKPYMRLTDAEGLTSQTVTIGSDEKILFTAELPDGLTLKDVPFSVQVINFSQKDKAYTVTKEECLLVSENEYLLLLDTSRLGIGAVRLRLTLLIPDTDFPGGTRRTVVNINPNVIIKG